MHRVENRLGVKTSIKINNKSRRGREQTRVRGRVKMELKQEFRYK